MIVVLGAGITGLAPGLELDLAGEEFPILESKARPGGVIRSAEDEGRILDRRPRRLRLTEAVGRLVERLSLEERWVEAPPDLDLYVHAGSELRAKGHFTRIESGTETHRRWAVRSPSSRPSRTHTASNQVQSRTFLTARMPRPARSP